MAGQGQPMSLGDSPQPSQKRIYGLPCSLLCPHRLTIISFPIAGLPQKYKVGVGGRLSFVTRKSQL